jgi:quercetin dioxygenase-like cupin family protein
MHPVRRLCEDVLANDVEVTLPALPRMIFVVHGRLAVPNRVLNDGEAWSGEAAVTFMAGSGGATVWRWELVADGAGSGPTVGPGIASREKLAAELTTLPNGALILRGDSVAFPPGGRAYLHRHQGPGIRCLLDGAIRIDTRGYSHSYGPGSAWYETGPDGVFAQAAADRPTRFIRVMILPLACLGKSSVEYLNEEDKAKPKSQQYKIFADMPLTVIPTERSESRNP